MVWRKLLSQDPHDPHHLESKRSRNNPKERDNLLSQLACLCISSCDCVLFLQKWLSSELVLRNGGIGNQGEVCEGKKELLMQQQIQQSVEGYTTHFCNGLIYVNNGIIFPGQHKAKADKELYGIRIRVRMVTDKRRNRRKYS